MTCETPNYITYIPGNLWSELFDVDELDAETQELIGPLTLADYEVTACLIYDSPPVYVQLDSTTSSADGSILIASNRFRVTISGARLATLWTALGTTGQVTMSITIRQSGVSSPVAIGSLVYNMRRG